MTIKIEIKGTKEVEDFLKAKSKEAKLGSSKGINKASFFMQGEVKLSIAGQRAELTSVDNGRFLNSVDITTSEDTGVIFTDIDYAKFLEYGTSKFNARGHFRNSKFRNQDKVKEIIETEVKSGIK